MINEFRLQTLCRALDQYNEIIIYGAGDYARRVYPVLAEYGLKYKITSFVQTQESQLKSIEGIPVIKVEVLSNDKSDCAVLIAVSELYADEIKQILVEYPYLHIFSLIDYRVHTDEDFKLLDTFEDYCDYIADWYIETKKGTVGKEALVQKLLIRGKSAGANVNSKLIINICGHKSVRSNKIMGALKRNGYEVITLAYYALDKDVGWCTDELNQLNIQRVHCYCIEEMLYEALQYEPLAYFFEPCWADCLWAAIMVKNKKYFGKIALALYDVLNDGIINQSQERLDSERYALENADGIVWRWFSKDYLERKGFNFQGRSVQFLDYCSHREEDYFFRPDTESPIIKMCEVGGVADSFVEERPYNTKYIDWARIGEILEKIGNRKDCIFHFYAGRMKKENIERCLQYEKQYNNFKFFLGTEHDQLLEKLSDYDYGCDFYTDGEWPQDDVIVSGFAGSTRKNCVRNILFDYLSAGLPIITTTPQKLLEYLEPYNVVVQMNISNLDFNYLQREKHSLKKNVCIAREKLDIDNQLPTLIDFLCKL